MGLFSSSPVCRPEARAMHIRIDQNHSLELSLTPSEMSCGAILEKVSNPANQ